MSTLDLLLDLFFLPRETRELAKLNKIFTAFNEGKLTPLQAKHEIYKHKWKYHHEKIDMLITCCVYNMK